VGCGKCVENCIMKAITLDDDDKAEIDKSKCSLCGRCINDCEKNACIFQ
jgi:ferredoxin